jgi:NADP-dependent 3-hydroxy acid dehydrogenase YdfG
MDGRCGRGVVFGGSSGIGAAVAERLARGGASVVAASRRGAAAGHAGVVAVPCDVRDGESVARVLRDAALAGGVDWVVNAAGVGFYAPVLEQFAPQWRDIIETNVVGMLNVLAQLRELHRPVRHFVQVGSLAGTRPSRTPGNDVYAATKAAGAMLLARFRAELRAEGVLTRTTLITPGYVGGTDFGEYFFRHAPDKKESLFDRFAPLSPIDVAMTIEYALAQPDHLELSEIVVRPVEQPN